MERFLLGSGASIPAIGCGTVNYGREGHRFPNRLNGDYSALDSALRLGYRLFDTAVLYGNEDGVGAHLQASGIPREELFLIGKIPNIAPYNQTPEDIRACVDASLRRLRLEYFDLLLIHHAVPPQRQGQAMNLERTAGLWVTLDKLRREGKLRNTGVSNFDCGQLKQLIQATQILPAADQIRFNPAVQDWETVAFCRDHAILPIAHSPLNFTVSRGKRVEDPVYRLRLEEIGARHGKSWAQILLRYNYQSGICSIPASFNPLHQQENLDIFDFSLDPEEMRSLTIQPADRLPDSAAVCI